MNAFAIEISSQERAERIEGVVNFTGRDESGSFGILAHRAPLATALAWGLCRLVAADGKEEYLAIPGGMLFFDGEILHVAARFYVRGADSHTIASRLTEEEEGEAQSARELRELLRRLDRELLRRATAFPTNGLLEA